MSNISEALAKEILKELRVRRKWRHFFKLLWLVAIVLLIIKMTYTSQRGTESHTAIIDIAGSISEMTTANTEDLSASLQSAFENPTVKGIILRINSPGGTPVTVSELFNEVRRLKDKYPNTKIYSVCLDICTSGAYYLASATDAIYANPSSFIGSIAVIFSGFGFPETLNKLGIERRMYTSGENKGFLDPFSPVVPNQVEILKSMLNDVHQQFVNDVKKGRGAKLKDTPDLFSGLYWTGLKAKELGLIDGFGGVNYVAREIIKEENLVDYTIKPNYFQKVSKQFD